MYDLGVNYTVSSREFFSDGSTGQLEEFRI